MYSTISSLCFSSFCFSSFCFFCFFSFFSSFRAILSDDSPLSPLSPLFPLSLSLSFSDTRSFSHPPPSLLTTSLLYHLLPLLLVLSLSQSSLEVFTFLFPSSLIPCTAYHTNEHTPTHTASTLPLPPPSSFSKTSPRPFQLAALTAQKTRTISIIGIPQKSKSESPCNPTRNSTWKSGANARANFPNRRVTTTASTYASTSLNLAKRRKFRC